MKISSENQADFNSNDYLDDHYFNQTESQLENNLGTEDDNQDDNRNVLPFTDYMGEQIKIAFEDQNIERLTNILGHKPSDMEVIEDYINSGKAEEWAKKNKAA